MTQSHRTLSRAGISVLAGLSLILSPISPVGNALADATYSKGISATEGTPQVYPADAAALHWGFSATFREKGTAFEAADGARYDAASGQFIFPDTGWDEAPGTANYGGSVTMLGDCEVPDDPTRGTCAVDVTFTEPTVTIYPDGGATVSATVHSTRDGETWFGPERLVLADLDFGAARFNGTDAETTWVYGQRDSEHSSPGIGVPRRGHRSRPSAIHLSRYRCRHHRNAAGGRGVLHRRDRFPLLCTARHHPVVGRFRRAVPQGILRQAVRRFQPGTRHGQCCE
ncbi:HtaA domain-containing protein [Corynebacterium meridianum]|uniref:HtaA domain-containing protein n=1 Tax=Corynebacterium meridianum TaxID=2765363 RepID=A0A934HXQ4_9CORY|nr:HtaA domain-containing protein [Corynebacterium meridianum]